MKIRLFVTYLVFIFIFIAEISCTKSIHSEHDYSENGIFRIWALADIQPRNPKERNAFTQAINDINKNIPDVKFSIVAGDIVHTTDEDTFDWYLGERKKSYVSDWYEIIGNHDLKPDRGVLFKEKLRNNENYSITAGNMLFIFMSDSERGKATEISDDTFLWWKNLVVNNQDKIITVVTHAPIQGSRIPFSELKDRQVAESKRFREVLKDYKVDLWLSGHLHIPNEFTNSLNRNENLNDTIFVHISSIRPEFLGLKNSQSRVLEFICGENAVRIKSRDHEEESWNTELETDLKLSKAVECN